ncbi:Spore germination protein B3 precursor [compost metagenome]
MKKVEKLFEKEVLRMINEAMRKTQKVYKADVVGFYECLSIQNPKVWKKVKDRWDDLYENIPVNVKVKLTISDFGSSTK